MRNLIYFTTHYQVCVIPQINGLPPSQQEYLPIHHFRLLSNTHSTPPAQISNREKRKNSQNNCSHKLQRDENGEEKEKNKNRVRAERKTHTQLLYHLYTDEKVAKVLPMSAAQNCLFSSVRKNSNLVICIFLAQLTLVVTVVRGNLLFAVTYYNYFKCTLYTIEITHTYSLLMSIIFLYIIDLNLVFENLVLSSLKFTVTLSDFSGKSV